MIAAVNGLTVAPLEKLAMTWLSTLATCASVSPACAGMTPRKVLPSTAIGPDTPLVTTSAR